MNFRTNFSKTALLSNSKIIVEFDDKTVELVPPTLSQYLHDLDMIQTLGVLRIEPKDFNDIVLESNFIVDSKMGVLLSIFDLKQFNGDKIKQTLFKIFPNLTYNRTEILCEGLPLSNEEFDLLLKMLQISCDEQKFEVLSQKSQEDSEIDKKLKEKQDKVNQLKKKTKEIKQDSKNTEITMDQIVMALCYEFPSFTPEYIFNMNVFSVMYYYSYIGKIIDNQIQIVAAGNGLTKEFKYFI
jgi:hypothetical protein